MHEAGVHLDRDSQGMNNVIFISLVTIYIPMNILCLTIKNAHFISFSLSPNMVKGRFIKFI